MFKSEEPFVVLYTTNITDTERFFRTLQVDIKEVTEDKVVVMFGGFNLHYILNTAEPSKEYEYIAEPHGYGQGTIYYIETTDLEKTKTAIKEAGGKIIADIFSNHWGCQELLTEDPNGYKFAFYS
jgi:uncharacterized glyoxalase superfamily protein PhnB